MATAIPTPLASYPSAELELYRHSELLTMDSESHVNTCSHDNKGEGRTIFLISSEI
jgi:hypothetical protein